MIQTVVKSAVEILRIFAESRTTLIDLRNVARLAEQNGQIFLGVSKLLTSLEKSQFRSEMLQFILPSIDNDIKHSNYLHSKENGFYNVGDFLHIDILPEYEGSGDNSCIGSVLQFLKTSHIFNNQRPDGKIAIYDILKVLIDCQMIFESP